MFQLVIIYGAIIFNFSLYCILMASNFLLMRFSPGPEVTRLEGGEGGSGSWGGWANDRFRASRWPSSLTPAFAVTGGECGRV